MWMVIIERVISRYEGVLEYVSLTGTAVSGTTVVTAY